MIIIKNDLMERTWIALSVLFIFFAACKNADKGKDEQTPQVIADSLYQEVIDIHNEGMAAWMKIEKKKEAIKSLLDSIAALPVKMKTAAEPYKVKLNEAINDLTAAYDDMDKWMPTLKLDSARNDLEKRIDYFSKEKIKAETVNQAIYNSLQKADSLLKIKF